jgi:hypothetical protein
MAAPGGTPPIARACQYQSGGRPAKANRLADILCTPGRARGAAFGGITVTGVGGCGAVIPRWTSWARSAFISAGVASRSKPVCKLVSCRSGRMCFPGLPADYRAYRLIAGLIGHVPSAYSTTMRSLRFATTSTLAVSVRHRYWHGGGQCRSHVRECTSGRTRQCCICRPAGR